MGQGRDHLWHVARWHRNVEHGRTARCGRGQRREHAFDCETLCQHARPFAVDVEQALNANAEPLIRRQMRVFDDAARADAHHGQ